ncbi:MAG: DNA alkylation repair protein [Rickettsiaceae bacterium]|nr:DNA alkylation repair protein [Rickettsiaceae bacterium]
MFDTMYLRKILEGSIDSTPEKLSIYFKTGRGDYAEHDRFMGITVPTLRKIAKLNKDIDLEVIKALLQSEYNEERLLALLMLVDQYQKANYTNQEKLCNFYLDNLNHINNWNLVDSSAHHILGHFLWDKDRSILTKLALSQVLWERRIAIVSTWHFIRSHELDWTFKIAELLLNDPQDLIHKATGWMLREAGKKDKSRLILFLSNHADKMPKTMLRYAIERLSEEEKAQINYKPSGSRWVTCQTGGR